MRDVEKEVRLYAAQTSENISLKARVHAGSPELMSLFGTSGFFKESGPGALE